jgi:hypothetical protein
MTNFVARPSEVLGGGNAGAAEHAAADVAIGAASEKVEFEIAGARGRDGMEHWSDRGFCGNGRVKGGWRE